MAGPEDETNEQLAGRLREAALAMATGDWTVWARAAQLPPPGDWATWLLIGGRGSGKTRAGAEWVRDLATQDMPVPPIALVGISQIEALAVMVKGESGLLAIHPDDKRPKLTGSTLTWPNGTEAQVLSASDPESFRGPQFSAAWCDELGKWPKGEAAWDMLQFGLRLGSKPRAIVTTTPRPTKLLKRLLAEATSVVTRMRTADNRAHLADGFVEAVSARYGGSVLGRQELDGELIEDRPDALWTRDAFLPVPAGVEIGRIVVAVDPPVTGGPRSDACGIVVAGRAGEHAVVLEDCSFGPAAPLAWARRAVAAFEAHDADALVVEVNQGGDLVRSVIAQVDPTVPVRAVRASRGKWLRAEPVAALYGRGLVMHRPGLTELEDEMCAFATDGLADGHSPDRVDALVWALTDLMLAETRPRIRGL